MARLSAALTVVSTKLLRCVEEIVMQRTAVCLTMDGGYLKSATVIMRHSQIDQLIPYAI